MTWGALLTNERRPAEARLALGDLLGHVRPLRAPRRVLFAKEVERPTDGLFHHVGGDHLAQRREQRLVEARRL